MTRRTVGWLLFSLVSLVVPRSSAQVATTAAPPAEGHLRLTLLGTGAGPTVDPIRSGPSTLIEAGSEVLLFDAGRGATRRLSEAGQPFGSVTTVFLTHLHSDHIVDLADLFLSPWGSGARRAPLEILGPDGTLSMAHALNTAFAFDLQIRRNAQNEAGARLVGHDMREGEVWDRNGVKVSAFLVDHGTVKPAYGYRIDYAGHSVVLSGDTRKSETVAAKATGVDVLVHEIADDRAPQLQRLTPEQRAAVLAIHTTAEEAADIFSRARPRLAVYAHIAGDGPALVERTRRVYGGRVEAGEDLMTIDIGDDVRVLRR